MYRHPRADLGVHLWKTCLFEYTENFTTNTWKFLQIKNSDILHTSAQNIDCGYSLEPPRRGGSNEYLQSMFRRGGSNEYLQSMFRRGGSNEYLQSMFWAEIRKIMYTSVNPIFTT